MKANHWISIALLSLGLAQSSLANVNNRQAREQEKAFLATREQQEGVLKTRSGLLCDQGALRRAEHFTKRMHFSWTIAARPGLLCKLFVFVGF